jgi:hypothetical protein
MTTAGEHEVSDAELAQALDAGRQEAAREFRARSARYVVELDAVEIVTAQDGGFLVPRRLIGALRDVPPEVLAGLEAWPDGSAVAVEALDVQVSVHGLLSAALPAMVPEGVMAGLFARRGGQATSAAKGRSARENGCRGGRPRKGQPPAGQAA